MYDKKIVQNKELREKTHTQIVELSKNILQKHSDILSHYKKTIHLLLHETHIPLTDNNNVTILKNGEETFPAIKKAIKAAKDHIHMMYYTFKNDELGREIIDLLIEKSKQWIQIRFVFDDVGSPLDNTDIQKKMRAAKIEVSAF